MFSSRSVQAVLALLAISIIGSASGCKKIVEDDGVWVSMHNKKEDIDLEIKLPGDWSRKRKPQAFLGTTVENFAWFEKATGEVLAVRVVRVGDRDRAMAEKQLRELRPNDDFQTKTFGTVTAAWLPGYINVPSSYARFLDGYGIYALCNKEGGDTTATVPEVAELIESIRVVE